jgi:2,3-bisphosphoglycerate-independent phosphoglycerate mutase
MTNVLAEWLSKQGASQAHIAETEKYAHVTFFFNGGVEKQFPSEERHMISSPRVATYDLQPEMSAQGVADKVAEVVKSHKHEFVMCNFAPPDMVGHTGIYDAAVKAITATDKAVGTISKACEEAGYVLLITADHGNAEQMVNAETGAPHTAHTTNKVPFIMAGEGLEFVQDEEGAEEPGALADVAPTVLAIMGLPQPEGEWWLVPPFVALLMRLRRFRDDWTIATQEELEVVRHVEVNNIEVPCIRAPLANRPQSPQGPTNRCNFDYTL